jgi:hypothetical protein
MTSPSTNLHTQAGLHTSCPSPGAGFEQPSVSTTQEEGTIPPTRIAAPASMLKVGGAGIILRPLFVSSNYVLFMVLQDQIHGGWVLGLAHGHLFQLLINWPLICIYVHSSDSSFLTSSTNQLLSDLLNWSRFPFAPVGANSRGVQRPRRQDQVQAILDSR